MNDILNNFEEESIVDLQQNKYLTFVLADRTFAFPIKTVYEIIKVQTPTPVPEFPSYAKGIINTKGKVVPVVDLRKRFMLEEIEYNERTCIIIMNIVGIDIGFIVDTVKSVVEINEAQLSGAPAISNDSVTRYISSVAKFDNELVIVLDGAKIIDAQSLEIMSHY